MENFQVVEAAFYVDTFLLMPLCGELVCWLSGKLAKDYESRKRWMIFLCSLTLFGFWVVAGGFWFNKLQIYSLPLVGDWFRQFGEAREFMVNFEWQMLFGKNLVDPRELQSANFWSYWNLRAMMFFLLAYPISLMITILLHLIFFGRSRQQTGVTGLIPLPWRKK